MASVAATHVVAEPAIMDPYGGVGVAMDPGFPVMRVPPAGCQQVVRPPGPGTTPVTPAPLAATWQTADPTVASTFVTAGPPDHMQYGWAPTTSFQPSDQQPVEHAPPTFVGDPGAVHLDQLAQQPPMTPGSLPSSPGYVTAPHSWQTDPYPGGCQPPSFVSEGSASQMPPQTPSVGSILTGLQGVQSPNCPPPVFPMGPGTGVLGVSDVSPMQYGAPISAPPPGPPNPWQAWNDASSPPPAIPQVQLAPDPGMHCQNLPPDILEMTAMGSRP